MSKPILYLFNGKVARVGSAVLGKPVEPPTPFNYVTIGTQKWMSENLSIDDGGTGIMKKSITLDGVSYGDQYFYTYTALKRIMQSVVGWHIPSEAEFSTLMNSVGSTTGERFVALASTAGWIYSGGSNTSGFNAYPFGAGIVTSSPGYYAFMWTSDEYTSGVWNCSYIFAIERYGSAENTITVGRPNGDFDWDSWYLSVRLVKDS